MLYHGYTGTLMGQSIPLSHSLVVGGKNTWLLLKSTQHRTGGRRSSDCQLFTAVQILAGLPVILAADCVSFPWY